MQKPEKIRNIAIIAHIDHGKTTLLNELLKQAKAFKEHQLIPERVMDSFAQEQERGITIFSKHTSIYYNDYKINIIDTPGHADFSSEVERVLGMVNSVLLIVDAQDGPMPQTRFVLSKSLKMGLNPIVILNKIDRPNADSDRVLNETFDLFVELGANDTQLDFKYCYASALKGYAKKDLDEVSTDMKPLFEVIIDHVPPPTGSDANPFLIQASTITHDDFLGRQACGRILEGKVKKGDLITHLDKHGNEAKFNITKVEGYFGLEKIELDIAGAGDIVCISGIENVTIGDTLCDPGHIIHLPPIEIEEPTVSIDILVNDGPFAGKSGKHITFNKIRDRLYKERKSNISYQITEPDKNNPIITVSGRGELHLGILLESMRREGYEFCISKPQVILKIISDKKHEPISKVYVEVPEEYSGSVIEQLSKRKGEMQQLSTDEQGITHLEFLVPTRGIMGYRNEFLTTTRGLGIFNSTFDSYMPHKGAIIGRLNGALISICAGKTNGYACFNLESRGKLFTKPGDEVYEGMIVGEHNKENDLVVNITKSKQLTNVRASGTDEQITLSPSKIFNLEEALCYIKDDELIEVTPDLIRLRKKYLKENERKTRKK
jgi:GTP-binding protein